MSSSELESRKGAHKGLEFQRRFGVTWILIITNVVEIFRENSLEDVMNLKKNLRADMSHWETKTMRSKDPAPLTALLHGK